MRPSVHPSIRGIQSHTSRGHPSKSTILARCGHTHSQRAPHNTSVLANNVRTLCFSAITIRDTVPKIRHADHSRFATNGRVLSNLRSLLAAVVMVFLAGLTGAHCR